MRVKPKRLTEVVTFRVDKAVMALIERLAETQERKRADVVRRIFLQAVSEEARKITSSA